MERSKNRFIPRLVLKSKEAEIRSDAKGNDRLFVGNTGAGYYSSLYLR